MSSTPAEPFTVAVPEEKLHDLKDRLRRTRFPVDLDNEDWAFGFNTAYLRELVDYWLNNYDWRATELAINAFHNYKTAIDGVPVHFIHERGKGPSPKPLILSHGWPWTFWDFRKVIGPLTDPASYGCDPADSFDLVVFGLPGFGFSSPLLDPDWNFTRTAAAEVTVMRDVLDYNHFFAAGGDIGSLIVAQLGHAHADVVDGIYTHLAVGLSTFSYESPDKLDEIEYEGNYPFASSKEYTAVGEEDWFQRNMDFVMEEAGYSALQMTKPQTVAAALHDSPSGLMAWLIEKRKSWADTRNGIETVFSKDDLCDTASIYWFTDTYVSSARAYKNMVRRPWKPAHNRVPVVEAPSAISTFVEDLNRPPHRWVEKYFNLKQYRVYDEGGHFTPFEKPDIFVDDIRDFFRTIR